MRAVNTDVGEHAVIQQKPAMLGGMSACFAEMPLLRPCPIRAIPAVEAPPPLWRLMCVLDVHCDKEHCPGVRGKCTDYTVSNLKVFPVHVQLLDSHGNAIKHHPRITLKANVVFSDDGMPVTDQLPPNAQQFAESVRSEQQLVCGSATFHLRLGKQVTTDKLSSSERDQKRLFRIQITALEPEFAGLCVQTVAVRSFAKLPCRRRDPAPTSVANAPSTAAPAPAGDLARLTTNLLPQIQALLLPQVEAQWHARHEESMAEIGQLRSEMAGMRSLIETLVQKIAERHVEAVTASNSEVSTPSVQPDLQAAFGSEESRQAKGSLVRVVPPEMDDEDSQDAKRARALNHPDCMVRICQ